MHYCKLAGVGNGTASEWCNGLLYDTSSNAVNLLPNVELLHRIDPQYECSHNHSRRHTMPQGTQGSQGTRISSEGFDSRLALLINKRRLYMQARQTVTKRFRDESDLLGDLFRANERMYAYLYRLIQRGGLASMPVPVEPLTSSTPQRSDSAYEQEREHETLPEQMPAMKSDADSWLVDPLQPPRRASAPEYRPARTVRTAPVRPPKSPPRTAPNKTEPKTVRKASSQTQRQSRASAPQVRHEAPAPTPAVPSSVVPSAKPTQKPTLKSNSPIRTKGKSRSPRRKLPAGPALLSAAMGATLHAEAGSSEQTLTKSQIASTVETKPEPEPLPIADTPPVIKDEPVTQREVPAPEPQHTLSVRRSKDVKRSTEPVTGVVADTNPSHDAVTQPPQTQIAKNNSSRDDSSGSTWTSTESGSKTRRKRRRKRPRLSLDELNEPGNTPNHKRRASAPAAAAASRAATTTATATIPQVKPHIESKPSRGGIGADTVNAGASNVAVPKDSTPKRSEHRSKQTPDGLSDEARRLKQLFSSGIGSARSSGDGFVVAGGGGSGVDDVAEREPRKVQSSVKFTPKRAGNSSTARAGSGDDGGGLGIAGYKTPGQVDRAVRALNSQRQRRARGVAAKETVLGHARKGLEGYTCAECVAFFQAEADADPNPEKRMKELLRHCRHKAVKPPPQTPDGYYDLTFPETQTQPPTPPPPPAPLRELNRNKDRATGKK